MKESHAPLLEQVGPPRLPLWKRIAKWIRMKLLCTFKFRFIEVGRHSYLGHRCRVRPNSVRIGNYSFIGCQSLLQSKLTIGNWVMFAGNVAVVGGDHVYRKVGTPSAWCERDINREVIVEDDVWIGYGVIIMHGVRIGEGAIAAAGSIITKDVEPYTVVAGIPAKAIAKRFSEEEEALHRESLAALRRKHGLVSKK